jgi:hypothetical protein
MNAPDEDPAIASLLDEAAQLATAANEKLSEALAIAERDAAFNADRQWFKLNPTRSYRARLATQQEVADLHASGAWPEGWTLDPSCFIWALVRESRTQLTQIATSVPDLQSERLIH